jgi:hypothetical protein
VFWTITLNCNLKVLTVLIVYNLSLAVAYRGEGFGGFKPPPPKFRNLDKVPKIKKILLYEMKFLVPNYRCLQNPWLGGHCPKIPVLSVLNWICWTPPRIKFLGTPLVTGTNKNQLTDYDVHLPILHQCVRRAATTSNGNPFSQPPVELCKFHIFTR